MTGPDFQLTNRNPASTMKSVLDAEPPPLTCSFCEKTQKQVKTLVAGPGVCICDECISMCNDIMVEKVRPGLGTLPEQRPRVDESVVGDAGDALSIRPPRSTYTSSEPLTMTSVILSIGTSHACLRTSPSGQAVTKMRSVGCPDC